MSEAKQIKLYLIPEVRSVLEIDPPDTEDRTTSLSDRANLVISRYQEITSEATPALTESQWCAICDAANGLFYAAGMGDPAAHLWMEVTDSPGLGEKWGIDQGELVLLLSGLPRSALCAVSDVVQRFWARSHLHEHQREALEQSGARIRKLYPYCGNKYPVIWSRFRVELFDGDKLLGWVHRLSREIHQADGLTEGQRTLLAALVADRNLWSA